MVPESIRIPTDIVAVVQDQIVPEADLLELTEGIQAPTRLHRIHSLYGHDAFLKEESQIAAIVRRTLNRTC